MLIENDYKLTGPLLNSALAFGQFFISGDDFAFWIEYLAMPLAGSAIAIFFYEYVFIKSREYLDDEDEEPEDGD